MTEAKVAVQPITLAKALKVKNRLAGRLAKVQADVQAYNSVPEGQAGQVNVPALLRTRDELVEALVGLKAAVSYANREVQRDIYDLAEKKAAAQFLAGVIRAHRGEWLVFLHDPAVPPTNNHAEQMLRPAVITRKVGGCNKTLWGALVHGILASLMVTCPRRGRKFLDLARQLWQVGEPQAMPLPNASGP
jgi:hypothetical protein